MDITKHSPNLAVLAPVLKLYCKVGQVSHRFCHYHPDNDSPRMSHYARKFVVSRCDCLAIEREGNSDLSFLEVVLKLHLETGPSGPCEWLSMVRRRSICTVMVSLTREMVLTLHIRY